MTKNKSYAWLIVGSLVFASPMSAVADIITFNSDDPNLPIAFQGGPNTITSTFNIANTGTILDLNASLSLDTGFFSELSGSLIAPDGTVVSLFDFGTDVQGGVMNVTFDDEAATSIVGNDAFFDLTGTFSPVGSLSDFDSQLIAGDWTLSLTDTEDVFLTDPDDLNTLFSWGLTVEVPEPGSLTLLLLGGLLLFFRKGFLPRNARR